MASLRLTGITMAIATGLGTVMFFSNPGEQSYQEYAEQNLGIHLKQKLCSQASEQFGGWMQNQCYTLVDTARPHLAQFVSQQTQRQNLLLFSIYRTDLPTPPPLPSYHLETLGILGNFYTYYAKEY